MAEQIQAAQQLSSTNLYSFAQEQQIGARVKEYQGAMLGKSLLGITLIQNVQSA